MATYFKSYGKLDEADQAKLEARRKTKKRIAIIVLSSIVLVAVVVAAVFGTKSTEKPKNNNNSGDESLSTSIKAVCGVTLYPDSCYTSLEPVIKNSKGQKLSIEQIFKLSLQVAVNELSQVSQHFAINGSLFKGISDEMSIAAIESCNELFGLALDHLNDSLALENFKLDEALDDLKTWLSSTGTYQDTCIDGFENSTGKLSSIVSNYLKNATEFTSNSLAIVNAISNYGNIAKTRRLMSLGENDHEMPNWLSRENRRLLASYSTKIKADLVVAKDKSGNYKTISAALKAVPDKSKKRFVIYVKKGIYVENVRVEKPKWNVMVIGDGMDTTIVSGRLNVVDGTPTFRTATFAVFGKGFIARDIGFRNTAGAAKHQAVALMSTADESIFYRCRIDAFQDSLYAHSNRQFYRECNIYGTVDFIFGNSAVVIQNSNILPRVPMKGQKNTITAQGKIDPNQNTGISIQNCTIWNYGNLSNVQTYLGRPWKNYSTTVYTKNMMGGLIEPKGWLPWVGDSAPNTIFYAEFENFGPGSSTKNRVKWKGLRKISSKQANKFTVKSFIKGEKWLKAAKVPHNLGL